MEERMKELFPGYFKESEDDLKEIWVNCIYVFDANILLNLYRYSDLTRAKFFHLLRKLNSRIWLPHRAAEEYLNNRLLVIDQQERAYDETTKSIERLKSDLENARQHPFVCEDTLQKVNNIFDDLNSELSQNKYVHTKRINEDEILEEISDIFRGKVGHPFNEEQLNQVIEEGKLRFQQKIPPGYKDDSKSQSSSNPKEQLRKYGDLLLWKQIIYKASKKNTNIIFVTDDRKEDWWHKFKGKTLRTRPELIEEFLNNTSQSFLMYQADRFLELARSHLDEQVSDELIEEIKAVQKMESQEAPNGENKNVATDTLSLKNQKNNLLNIDSLMMQHEREEDQLLVERNRLENQKRELQEKLLKSCSESYENKFDDEFLRSQLESKNKSLLELNSKLTTSRFKYQELQREKIRIESEYSDLA